MSRDYRLYLDDMRESCEKVLRYTRDLTFDQFARDEKTFFYGNPVPPDQFIDRRRESCRITNRIVNQAMAKGE